MCLLWQQEHIVVLISAKTPELTEAVMFSPQVSM